MCDCKVVTALIAEDGIRLACECGDSKPDAELTRILELVSEYLRSE